MLWRTPSSLRGRATPTGFIVPCQPMLSRVVPAGSGWIHELKHDGFRILARRDGGRVRLWSRSARDHGAAFTAIASALGRLAGDAVIDGEAVAHSPAGLPDFHALLSRAGGAAACLYAFDLLFLDGKDLRPLPLSERRARLAALLDGAPAALKFSEHLEGGHGEAMFREASRMNLEGIVSKRLDRPYKSGRCPHWVKVKNPGYRRG
ncbi:MAG TPA: DNA ligase [Beijerinckiaceae bacterium]